MINEWSAPQEKTWKKVLRWTFRIGAVWAALCVLAFMSAAMMGLMSQALADPIDLPTWLPLPWSGLSSFVETADGKVFAILRFYHRVVCLEHDGTFVGTYPLSKLGTRKKIIIPSRAQLQAIFGRSSIAKSST